MRDDGKITREEFLQSNFCYYLRTEAEFAKPLADTDSPVYKAGLRLVSIETKILPCHLLDAWLGSGKSKGLLAIFFLVNFYLSWQSGRYIFYIKTPSQYTVLKR